MAKTHVMQRAPTPLLAMSAAEIAAVAVAVGDCIEYRTLDMLPEEPPRVCTVRECRENGTFVLDDETWTRRTRLTWLKLHPVELARDTAGPADGGNEDDQADPPASPAPEPQAQAMRAGLSDLTDRTDLAGSTGRAQHPAGNTSRRHDPAEASTTNAANPPSARPASAGAPPAVPAVRSTRRPPVDPNGTCRDCGKPFTRRSNVQKACPACTHAKALAAARAVRARKAAAAGRAFTPRDNEAKIAARCALVAQWNTLRSHMRSKDASAQLDTPENRAACRAKAITRDILGWYATQYRGQVLRTAGSPADGRNDDTRRLQDPGNADLPIGSGEGPAKASTTNAATSRSQDPSGVPASAGSSRRLKTSLCDRLIAFADRLCAAENLVSRAERALQILEVVPTAGTEAGE